MLKRLIKLGLVLSILITTVSTVALAGGSNIIYGFINGNVTATYTMYVTASPTSKATGSLAYHSGKNVSYGYQDVGNFYPQWLDKQKAIFYAQKGADGSGQYGVSGLTLSAAASSQDFPIISAMQAVSKPTAAVDSTNSEVDLSWSSATSAGSASDIAGYNVYRSTDGTTYTKVNSSVITSTSYSDKSGTAGTKYYYALKIVFAGSVESLRSADSSQVTYPSGGTPPPPPATSIIIDNYEGTTVGGTPTSPSDNVSSYYVLGPTAFANPAIARQTTTKNGGSYAMGVAYPSIADPTNAWRGFGGILKSALDLSPYTYISFYVKGDGTKDAKVKFQLKDADGSNYAGAETALSGTAWTKVSMKISDISTVGSAGATAGLDTKNIIEYQLVFVGVNGTANTSNSIVIDDVIASKESTSVPTSDAPSITSISPAKANSGDTIVISGSNLGTGGQVEFAGANLKSYIESAAAGSPISAWSATGITFKVPATLSSGKMDVSVIRSFDKKQSNTVTFEVTSQAVAASYNYPNPFNPNGGETTKIVFDSGTNTSATIYIFDMTAQMVEKLTWTGTAGAAEVAWNGYNSYGKILGDGAYMYRVAAGSSLIGRGKILIINK